MYTAGAMTIVVSALQRYLYEIEAIQEIRWTTSRELLRNAIIFDNYGQIMNTEWGLK